MSEYKPVPVEAASYVSHHCGKDVVVIGSIDHEHNKLHVTTFGRTAHDKILAAEAGEVVGKALGDMSRVERFEDFRLEPAKVKEQRDDLLAACRAVLSSPTSGNTPSDEAIDLVRAAIAKAEGK